ncbi:MAG TPA: hypothetical protein VNJ01_09410 [Bacteriovoracaceae bacterium]|nr:hypothetical protein [Bacteriovoracaceae bacterium]
MKNLCLLLSLALPVGATSAESLTGMVIEVVVDHKDHTSKSHLSLETENGVYRLEGKIPKAGSKITVEGETDAAGAMAVKKFTLISEPTSELDSLHASNDLVTILAVRLKFSGTAESACSVKELGDTLFKKDNPQSLKSFYQETSKQLLAVNGSVLQETIDLEVDAKSCAFESWVNLALPLLRKKGLGPGSFSHLMFLTPELPCGWDAVATLQTKYSMVNGLACRNPAFLAHQFGHNLGLHHATRPGVEYGDDSDIMGSMTQLRGFNIANKDKLGWGQPGEMILNTGTPQTIELTSLRYPGKNAKLPQSVKIQTSEMVNPVYLSFRKSAGYDASLPTIFHSRVALHSFGQDEVVSYPRSQLLEVLSPGGTYSLGKETGLSISVLEMNVDRAKIQIQRECLRFPATFNVMPLVVTAPKNTFTDTHVEVTNNDNLSCPATVFNLSQNLQNGAEAELPFEQLTLKPGESRGFTLPVRTVSWHNIHRPRVKVKLSDEFHKERILSVDINIPGVSAKK